MESAESTLGDGDLPAPSVDDGRFEGALDALRPGARLGRYELLRPIAQGGMAVVWAARLKGDHGFSKLFALKTMLPSLSGDAHFQSLFLAEAELSARIKHPNVCEVLDLGEQDGVLYLAMEWIDGDSLATLLGTCLKQGGAIPHAVAAKIVLEAAKGLHAAHELKNDAGELIGLVHRDVSPQNILVTCDGMVKIVDFGVAKVLARSEQQATKAGHVKGKVQYMAPEQAFCDVIDRRTDIFTLGIVLYQLTTGVHPFRADNDLATLARITRDDPVAPPETLVKGYPRLLGTVVEKALEKDPALRFATMADLARELEIVVSKLSALGQTEAVDTFVRSMLGERAAARAASLQQALRDLDEQADRPTPTGTRSRARPRVSSGARLWAALGVGAAVVLALAAWWSRGTEAPPAPAAARHDEAATASPVQPLSPSDAVIAPPAAPAAGSVASVEKPDARTHPLKADVGARPPPRPARSAKFRDPDF